MSIRIWEERATQKKQVEDQRAKILTAFKERKVADELGQVKAEKLFKPITKLLGKSVEEKDENFPDYDVDGEDINYLEEMPFHDEEDPYEDLEPFSYASSPAESEPEELAYAEGPLGSEKVTDYATFMRWLKEHEYDEGESESSPAASPFPSPVPSPSPVPEKVAPIAVPEEFSDEDEGAAAFPPGKKSPDPPRYSAATRDDVPPKYKEPRDDDSRDLTTLTRFIQNNYDNPEAKIRTKKSKFFGTSLEEAREEVYRIYTERAKKVLAKGDRKTTIGQKGLGPYEGKTNREMRAMIDAFEEDQSQGKMKFGSGLKSLVNRLSLGISSIFAGNTSVKLKKEIKVIANMLYKAGVLSEEQKNKVSSL